MSQSQQDLFKQDGVRNNPSRSSFDLGCKHAFTAKVGELLPVYHTMVIPADKFQVSCKHVTRTAPLNSDAFINLRESFDWFFVPLRLLWKSIDSSVTMLPKQPNTASSFTESKVVSSKFPSFSVQALLDFKAPSFLAQLFYDTDTHTAQILQPSTIKSAWSAGTYRKNFFGFNRAVLSCKLLSYLGYGYFDEHLLSENADPTDYPQSGGPNYFPQNILTSVFPLAAYQKIYQDWFRNTQWEDSQPYNFNFDWFDEKQETDAGLGIPLPDTGYYDKPTFIDLQYVDYTKDLFLGMQPRQQFGDTATVDVTSQIKDLIVSGKVNVPRADINYTGSSEKPTVKDGTTNDETTFEASGPDTKGAGLSYPGANNLTLQIEKINQEITGQFSVLSMRLAQFLQKYKEIKQSGRQDIADQVYRQFGVRMNEDIAGRSRYVGGKSNNIEISPVINNNLIDDNMPDIKGFAMSDDTHSFTFDNQNEEYGILMCMYYCQPTVDYALWATEPQVTVTDATQMPIPAFDSIGLQGVPSFWFDNSYKFNKSYEPEVMGYVPRYAEFKSNYDRVSGAFRSTLRNWVAAYTPEYFGQLWPEGVYIPNFMFFKVNPSFMDTVFSVKADSFTSTDQLLVNAYFDVRVARSLSYDGLPY